MLGEFPPGKKRPAANTPLIQVPDARKALASLAATFYARPYEGMNLIGITGTNGKTTTSYLLESILASSGRNPGVIGTINYRTPYQTWKAAVTTPEPLELMQVFRTMADAGISDIVMEVSSHALDQGRVDGCPFRIAVFTNLSRDHLDYHGSMTEYFKAKSLLFRGLENSGTRKRSAVINADDPKGEELAKLIRVPVITYGLGKNCDVRAEQVSSGRKGITARLVTPSGTINIRSSLIGTFNIYNLLAASASALCMDIDLEAVQSGIERLKGIPGRLELVENKRSLTIVVDYAHTPDALSKVLEAAHSLAEGGRLITVFGCGGDRDKGKRREMGLAAGTQSDLVIVTSDNPRTEDPNIIISQIEEGIRQAGLTPVAISQIGSMGSGYYIREPDRGTAIQNAIALAHRRDIILIAGKGHEDYQIIGKAKRHFDDREIAARAAA